MYRFLAYAALLLCLILIPLGAYVRLSDAGLGCPDWPGCYGKLTPEHAASEIANAQAASPEGPVSMPKAWKEMGHRYLAGVLGLCIAAMMLLAWFRKQPKEIGVIFPTVLAALVILQALFGKWTVTLLLKPAIVTGHLIGGMLLLAMLTWHLCTLRARHYKRSGSPALRYLTSIGLILVAAQIILGGWVSTNYAALACTDFPKCQGLWLPDNLDFGHGFTIARDLGKTANGELLSNESLRAIHWVHRLGALIVSLWLCVTAWAMLRKAEWRSAGLGMFALLTLQVTIGIANVLLSLPLALAVAHNAVAALLLSKMVAINFRAWRR